MLAEMMADRRYVSRFAIEPVGLRIRVAGADTDADGNVVEVRLESVAETPLVVFSRQALHVATGTYETLLSSAETSTPGLYRAVWTYSLDGVPQTFEALLEIGQSSPAYDALDVGMKGVIESVYMRFADGFDSPDGGPYLQVAHFVTNFGRGRMAQLLKVALGRLNTVAQPHTTYTLEGPPEGKPFPLAQWGSLLETALYIETIKHLIRSYTEQPDASNVIVARHDRRDYTSRWAAVLDMERQDFKDQMDGFKIAHMGLGRGRVLVSGGVFGNFGAERIPGLVARPHYWGAGY